MKPIKLLIIAAFLSSGFTSHAITNCAIGVSGTNIVLSWPSQGYESYLVQYRQTLNLTDSWSQLTNAYPANSTNRTTFTIYGLVPPHGTNGSGGLGGSDSPPSPEEAASAPSEPMVMPANGSGTATPLAIYPVGFDLSNFVIFDPATGQWVSGNGYVIQPTASALSGDIQPMDDSGGNTNVNTGFFRVFHIPDWLVSFSGYTFDGPTFLPVDYSTPDAPTNYIDSSTVLINGQQTDHALFMSYDIGGTTYWGMGIYFDRFPNGTNTIQLLTTVRQSDTLDDQTPYMVFSNAPQTIVIQNWITFTNWDDLIWNNTNCIFNAQTYPNANWEIDVYDVYGDFVNYQTGHTADGNISWTWDLVDYWGNPRNNPDSDPVFYPYFSVSQSSGNVSKQIQANGASGDGPGPSKTASFPGTGVWLFAYMDDFYLDAGGVYAGEDAYYKTINNQLAGGPELWNIPATSYPIKFGSTYTQADRDGSWTNLANLLANPQYRNFYYFGHGAPDFIGGDVTAFDAAGFPTRSQTLSGSKAGLTSQYVRDNITLHNPLGMCFYRFVFLDGCNTANGGWPDAWGVGKTTNSLDYYRSSANAYHMRPSVFVGWNTSPGGNAWGNANGSIGYRGSWMGNWSVENGNLDDGLSDIFTFTADNSPNNWPPGHSAQLWSALRVYGYRNIKFNEYNRQGDWP